MRKVAFLTRSFDEFNQWVIADKKVYAKIVSLIKDVQR
jgi:toxin YoeB